MFLPKEVVECGIQYTDEQGVQRRVQRRERTQFSLLDRFVGALLSLLSRIRENKEFFVVACGLGDVENPFFNLRIVLNTISPLIISTWILV
jgi:hypothetical protein